MTMTSRFGIREVADMTFRALSPMDIGNQHFDKDAVVFTVDTAQTSSLEGAATTVYAQGQKVAPCISDDVKQTALIAGKPCKTNSFKVISSKAIEFYIWEFY